MAQGKQELWTKSNTGGRVTVRRLLPAQNREPDAEKGKGARSTPNPRHKEGFDRLLGGMARSSE